MGLNPLAVWALCLVLLLAGGVKATPLVIGDGRDQVTAADVADLCALATAPSPLGEPVLIRANLVSRDGRTRTLSDVTVYLAPSATNARAWRGSYLQCYPVAEHHPGDEFYHWREAGKWMVGGTVASGGYAVFAPPDKELPVFTPEQFAGCDCAYLKSPLDLQDILDLVDTARAFRLLQPDGSELPFASLRIINVSTSTRDGGYNGAHVAFQPPPGEDPISAQLSQKQGKDWCIVRIQRWVYY